MFRYPYYSGLIPIKEVDFIFVEARMEKKRKKRGFKMSNVYRKAQGARRTAQGYHFDIRYSLRGVGSTLRRVALRGGAGAGGLVRYSIFVFIITRILDPLNPRILLLLRFKPDEEIGPSILFFDRLKTLSGVEGLRVVSLSNERFSFFEMASTLLSTNSQKSSSYKRQQDYSV